MKFYLLLIFSFFSLSVYSQGCSDAGFCTMGAMRPDQSYSKKVDLKLRSVEYNFYRGKTTTTPIVYAHTLEFNASINDLNTLQIKVPYMHVSGNLGSNQGIGDISISFTRSLQPINGWNFSGTLGFKNTTNNSNRNFSSENTLNIEVPLPMYYEVS